MAQLQNELAEAELIKKFRHDNSWLSEIKPKPNWVFNNVIKIPRQGTAPTVLINNNVYPIASNRREDDFINVSLNKYDTENTDVTTDELYALPYEKLSDVQQQHRETLEDVTAQHALYSLAVPAHSATTPVFETTGPSDGTTGRKRLVTADLIRWWKTLTEMGVPLKGRVLVLCPDHAADLMAEDEKRQTAWGSGFVDGTVPVSHQGFKLWVAAYPPRYAKVANVWTRQGFGAATGRPASVIFYAPNAVKAPGTVQRFALDASMNPLFRKHTIGFQLYFVAVGIKDEGFGAIVGADA